MAAPALACLPTSTMTKAEMECCKKMAGDCHMGSQNHPCCEKTAAQPSPVAAVQQPHVLHLVFTAVMLVSQTSVLPTHYAESHPLTLGLPPPAPPKLNSVLRI
jgi:hypothetical protein